MSQKRLYIYICSKWLTMNTLQQRIGMSKEGLNISKITFLLSFIVVSSFHIYQFNGLSDAGGKFFLASFSFHFFLLVDSKENIDILYKIIICYAVQANRVISKDNRFKNLHGIYYDMYIPSNSLVSLNYQVSHFTFVTIINMQSGKHGVI